MDKLNYLLIVVCFMAIETFREDGQAIPDLSLQVKTISVAV